jgi:GMP synthase (glutamine-hydrolysing)
MRFILCIESMAWWMNMDRILILDFGSQLTQLIARRVREHGVYAEIIPCTADFSRVQEYQAKGIILSGGPASVHVENAPSLPGDVFNLGVPVLGICYGMQLMCQALGGRVEMAEHREFGRAFVTVAKSSPLFEEAWNQGSREQVWMSHGDQVTALPPGFEVIAATDSAPFAAVADESKQFYGVQFHPEVMHTPHGAQLLKNFTHAICDCGGDWNMHAFLEDAIEKVRDQVGDKQVLCAVSGGVDSSVVAALIHRAIGDQIKCVFVDTGVLRQHEADQVLEMFREDFHIPVHHVDARDFFFSRLEGVTDPEKKRKIIGEGFIEVFEKEAEKLGGADFLAQGTLYPDVIESVSFHGGPSHTIKSHHNVGGLPERMNMALVEPVRELFKDEVRTLGEELGMSHAMVQRHPFPGPGLAIRIPGEVTQEKVDILQKADAIYLEEIRNAGLYDAIWQAFAVLLPVKTVGVMGDARTYEYVCALRAVTSTDGMTADFYHYDHEFLGRVSNRIINEVRGINRVVYDVTSKPPGTIEWE